MSEGKPLTSAIVKESLSHVGKTFGKTHVDGCSFAYLQLDLSNKSLTALSDDLAAYQQLRYIFLSNNEIPDLSVLARLKFVLKLVAAGNKVSDLRIFGLQENFRFLRTLDLSKNQIETLTPLALPELTHISLSHNQIVSAEAFLGHRTLQRLELRGNKLVSLAGIRNMPALTELYAAQNEIATVAYLEALPKLEVLHLRSNKVEGIDADSLPTLPALRYLNLRENPIPNTAAIAKLKPFPALTKLHVQGTPMAEEVGDNLKKEVLIVLPNLLIVNKEEVAPEEKEDAIAEAAERARQAEEARKEAERQAKEAEEKAKEQPPEAGDPES